jgi:hypothetical protein
MSEFVKVILQRNDCMECPREDVSFEEENEWHRQREFYSWEYPLEVPTAWLVRWEDTQAAYEVMQDELHKLIKAYREGRSHIEPPE